MGYEMVGDGIEFRMSIDADDIKKYKKGDYEQTQIKLQFLNIIGKAIYLNEYNEKSEHHDL
ncbi:MAG: hypothetical protein WA144_15370 [Candidatus Methanoperedens sp.]